MKQPLNFSAELVPLAYVEALLQLAGEWGIARAELLAAARLKPEVLGNPNGRLSFIDFNLLVSAVMLRSDEPALGLVLGQRLNVSTHGILGYAVLSSANLGKAIQFALKYYRVLGLTFELEMVEDGDCVELRASESMPLGALNRFAAESLLTSLYTIARFLVGGELQGVQVGFAYPPPSYAPRYQAVFAAPVAFEQPYHRLSLPRAYLQRPMALANPATVQMCEQQCEALLASLDVQDALLTRVRRLLLARPGDFPDLDSAARALHTSGRSLRRHLADMGTSYQQVLDDVRKRLALEYLGTTHLPLFEIASLLGFSDPSNFRRAFKKWTGKLPSDYRAEA
ncbi:AraC family transcriptional regulator [Pseudomonas cavernae]|uniref:AraC family transcriptional regulator n=1 Tax=Pseudomonas cavernae TaxID=2320867 RepID=A0A385Z1L6_9PSED|nr:AraC family transcriptional regulator [Pseudomonas cavernae]AYC31773.1 AraC family transcriptional regulator [Pseudomonas cavernae]